jgi:hypothetical protein
MDSTVRYMFFLMALLIICAYFVGAATETNALAAGILKLVNALQGKNAQGNFSNYPGGSPASIQTFS